MSLAVDPELADTHILPNMFYPVRDPILFLRNLLHVANPPRIQLQEPSSRLDI
jgi:hypothetical protein